jgi:fibronectin type 3 domain-containing protein
VSKTVTGSGTAAVAQQHSVGLSWTASTSTVTGYYVYRSSTSGGNYTKLISTPDVSTTYTDRTVLSGQTYFYVTTASASDGTESTYSNEVTAAIP